MVDRGAICGDEIALEICDFPDWTEEGDTSDCSRTKLSLRFTSEEGIKSVSLELETWRSDEAPFYTQERREVQKAKGYLSREALLKIRNFASYVLTHGFPESE